MSSEFRQRTPGEYAKIIWKRKWLIILPAIAVATAVAWVVYRLPDVYESSTLIVVKPSTLPISVVPTMAEDTITRQLSSIAQVVTSRSSLEPLVERYDLYKAERMRGEPMESIIETIRKDIKVEVNTSRNDITNGFNIIFRGRDPRATQLVTSELASKYINEQTNNTINGLASGKQFIDQQARQAKAELDEADKKRVEFMQQNVGNLPSGAGYLIAQLGGLRENQKALISDIGRMRDQRTAMNNQLNELQQISDNQRNDLIELTDVKESLAYGQLRQQKASLESQLKVLLSTFKPAHPDVKNKEAEISSVKQAMDEMVAEEEAKNEKKRKRIEKTPDLRITGIKSDLQRLDNEIARQQKTLDESSGQVAALIQRINDVPGAEVAVGALDREYQTRKSNYDSLLDQQRRMALGVDAANQQQGESIQVIDPAYLPSKPVAPKRLVLFAAGLALGLALGFLLAGVFEVPKLLTIQTREDAAHYTGMQVLVVIPELLTVQEARAIPRRRRLLLAAGFVVTIVSIPLLALALRATHLLEFFSTGRA